MAKQLYDNFANLEALEGEKKAVLGYFQEVKKGIIELNQMGIKIDSSKTLAANAKYQQQLEQSQQKYLVTQQKIDVANEIAREKAEKANLAETKRLREEAKLREDNRKAVEREAASIDKKNKANEKDKLKQENFDNQQKIIALRNEAAEQEKLIALEEERRKAEEAYLNTRGTGAGDFDEKAEFNNQSTGGPVAAVDKEDVDVLFNYRDELEELTGTLDENRLSHASLKGELSGVDDQLKRLKSNTTDAEKNTTRYKQRVAELEGKQSTLRKSISDTARVIKLQEQAERSAAGSAEQLRAKLELARISYDRLGASAQKSMQGNALQSYIKNLDSQVKQLEANTGRFQRNVGNYTSGLTGFFSKAYGGLRTLANILPGFGIAGLIGAIGTGLYAAAQALGLFSDKGKEVQNAIKEATSEANQEIGKEVGSLQTLYKVSQDNNQSLETRREATKKIIDANEENNKKTGEHNKILTDQNGIIIANQEGFDKLTASLIAQAKAKAFIGQIEKAYTKLLDEQNESLSSQTNIAQDAATSFVNLNSKIFSFFTGNRGPQVNLKKLQENMKQQGIQAAQGTYDALTKTFSDKLKSGEFSLDGLFDDKKGGSDAAANKAKQLAEQRRKDALERFKYEQGLLIEEQKAIVATESFTLNYRNQARKKQAELEIELIKGVTNFELANAKLTNDARAKLIQERDNGIVAAEVAVWTSINAMRIKAEADILAQIEALNKEFNDRDIKAREEIEKQKARQIDNKSQDFERDIRFLEEANTRELVALSKRYKSGKISKEKYEKEKLEIQERLNVQSLQKELDFQESLILISELSEDKQKAAIKRIHELRQSLSKAGIKSNESAPDESKKELEDALGKAQRIQETITSSIGGILDAVAIRQKNQIQEQLDNIDKVKAAEIDRINASTDSEEKKAARIKLVEAKAQTERERLERRRREIDMQRARFEKAAAISNIIISTALAIVRAPDPFSKAIAAASGAIQLGIAIATPIPQYFKGTQSAKRGLGSVAEQGSEIVEDKKGNIRLYKQKTLLNFAGGEKVYPAHVTRKMLAANNVANILVAAAKGEKIKDDEIIEQLSKLNKKPPTRIVIFNQSGIESSSYFYNQIRH